ncbi:MAG: hypothetical protein DI570_14400 [Phenylobacterium zucineum]|nr:MAG: hypothetical protein DI570_14400 [Phenylobacterium zucineum]
MRVKLWAVAAATLCLAGCAGGPGGPGRGPPPGFEDDAFDGPPRDRAQLFVSPSGEPFRAAGDQPYPSVDWFARADADKDGRLTRAEFRADAERWFKVLDANGDGQISMPEVTRWEEDLVPEVTRPTFVGGAAGGRGRGPGPDTRRAGAAAYSLINEPHPIRGADEDFSMGVSLAEWLRATDRRFAVLDPDGDGVILAGDLRPTPSQGPMGKPGEQRGGGQRPPGGQRGGPPPR